MAGYARDRTSKLSVKIILQIRFNSNNIFLPTSRGEPLLVATHSPGKRVDLKTIANAPSSWATVFSTSCRNDEFTFWDLVEQTWIASFF